MKKLLLTLLAPAWTALFVYGCSSTSQQSSQTAPQIVASLPSKSDQKWQHEARQEISGKAIWKASSGGFEIQWTAEDLFSISEGKLERIWQPLARRGYEEFAADLNRANQVEGGRTNNCDYRRDFQVLSIVGALVTFQDDEYSDCGGAHPTTERRFTMIDLGRQGEVSYGQGENALDADLKRPGKVVKLTDYFTESDILSALLADPVIKQALTDAGVSSAPQTLTALPEVFAGNDYVLSGTELELRPDFLTRFAFHHVEGDMIAVRLNLPSIAFAYRSQQIGLLLPIPAALKQPLALAASHGEGFLMKDAPPSIRDQFTRFSFRIGEGAKRRN